MTPGRWSTDPLFTRPSGRYIKGSTSGTLLKTIFTCYNAATPNCNSTAVLQPIAQLSVYVQWPSSGGLESRTDVFYNGYGSVIETDEYAYGAVSSSAHRSENAYKLCQASAVASSICQRL